MKVCLYYQHIDGPWGGINTFFRNFYKYCLRSNEVDIVDKNCDIFFYGAANYAPGKEVSYDQIANIRNKRDCIIVHRIDGLRGCYGDKYIPNDYLQLELTNLDDFIVFQSAYSRHCFIDSGYNGENWSTIVNGADQEVFIWPKKNYKLEKRINLIATSWSSNINKGFKTISELSSFTKYFTVTFVGNWNESVEKRNVNILKPIDHQSLAKLFCEYDLFLHDAKNDPCPNVVSEAMSSGLPVLYNTTGGTHEVVRDMGFILPEMIHRENVEELYYKIQDNYEQKIDMIRENLYNISFNKVVDQYLMLFKNLQKQ